MKVKTTPTHKANLWNVESAKPARGYIRFPIFYWKVFK